jgi:hypothetical protein
MMHRANWDGPKVSNPTAFAWFVWHRDHGGPSTWDRVSWTPDDRTTRVTAQFEASRQGIRAEVQPSLRGAR